MILIFPCTKILYYQLQTGTCDMDPLFCDPVHLAEVLRNLIWNAAESIKEEGIIKLSYHSQKKHM